MNRHAPFNLRCEYLINPLGIDTPKPRFSWLVEHDGKNQKQEYCQIIVSSSWENALKEHGDIWNSRRVRTKSTSNLEFNGRTLESSTRYYWRVRWWDSDGKVSPFSEIAIFETGLLKKDDWQADWVSMRNPKTFKSRGTILLEREFDEYVNTHGIYLRHEFECRSKIKRATAYICGLGFYELSINGNRIGDHVLDPPQTDYSAVSIYSAYDVTANLTENNAIGVLLGNGRYIPNYGWDQPKLIFQLHIEYENGDSEIIVSDKTWKASHGPLKQNGLYYGELYDARDEMPGWDKPDFDDSEWKKAVDVKGHSLKSQNCEPIRITENIKPVAITNPADGIYIIDFGQNFTGWVQMKVHGPMGTKVKLRHAELIHDDGTLNVSPNQGAEATDVFILKGDGVEQFEPRFTYHGFRYVEVTGFPGAPSIENFTGRFLHSDVMQIGSFYCSNELINKIHRNCHWGQLSNLMSIPTDCPQRDERYGWLGDAHLAAEAAMFCFDMAAFYTKFLQDIKLSQKPDGSIPDTVPLYLGRLYPADPAWGTAYITLAWYMYEFYGDKRILEEHYESMKKYVDYLYKNADHNIIYRLGKYGDWCPPGSIAPKKTPVELTSTWYFYYDTLNLSKIARLLNKKRDAGRYNKLASDIKIDFNRAFFETNQYRANKFSSKDAIVSQTSNVLPLYLKMPDKNKREKVFKKLYHNVVDNQDCHVDTGILGTRYLLEVLTDYGYADVAYKVATQETYPGWGYMIAEGATTLWERWEKITSGGMNSHNHIMLGSVDAWFYKTITGITNVSAGWSRIRIKPYMFDDLTFATAEVITVLGKVKSSWEKKSDSFEMQVLIPVGSDAEIHVPLLFENQKIRIDGKTVFKNGEWTSKSKQYKYAGFSDRHVTFEAGSGYYTILGEK